jgi:hypothetical protein
MPLALSDVIAQLRAELADAMSAGENEELRFELGPVEVELTVGVDKEAKPGAKAKFWVLELGTETRFAATSTQKVKLTLEPRHTSRPGRRPEISGDAAPDER